MLPKPHRGGAINQADGACLLRWEIDKLGTKTFDNTSFNDVAVLNLKRKLTKRNGLLCDGFHVRCLDHIMNLVVKDRINEVKDSILHLQE